MCVCVCVCVRERERERERFTLEVPVTNWRRRALSSLLKPFTTSQNHCITGEAAE
jgi:hypothetical protein